jgi:hypothetical protein
MVVILQRGTEADPSWGDHQEFRSDRVPMAIW